MSPKMRKTVAAMKAVHDAPQKAPWFALPLGLLALAFSGWRVYSTGAATKVDAVLVLGGLCALPGFMPYLSRNAQSLLGLYKTYRSSGGDSPPSDGNSP